MGIGVSIFVNGGAAFYALNEKFKLIPYVYNDEKVNVTLEKLPPPPPPPPPKKVPPPPPNKPPPVQPREVKIQPTITPPTIQLPIAQVKQADRKEYVAPPVIAPPAPPAPPAKPRPAVISNPHWLRTPDGSDLERYYPSQAKERGTEGRATVECTVTDSGSLTACSVVSEEPSGSGFGRATVQAASRFRMAPKTVDGAPVGGARVRVPLRWKLG